MGEVYWSEPYIPLSLPQGTIYAQTFSPLWSHNCDQIRIYLRHAHISATVKVSIQYLKPDGTPVGIDLTSYTCEWVGAPYGRYTDVRQRSVPPIRVVAGINYAFLVETLKYAPPGVPVTQYHPPPSAYTRGHLIKSVDGGATWDTSDHGDLLFGEFGDPPRPPSIYDPPIEHYAIISTTQRNYLTNACLRLATTEPSDLQCLVTDIEPTFKNRARVVRGEAIVCLDHYVFLNARSYDQKEKDDSMYHTFFLTKLKTNKKYWFAFQAEVNFETATSQGPVFERTHPEAPSFTKTLRPDAPGDLCTIFQEVGAPCPNHYLNIDEATPDENASYVINRYSATNWRSDLYNIPSLPLEDTAPIKKVVITARFKQFQGMPYSGSAYIILKTHGNVYQSSIFRPLPTWWVNRNWHVYLNPFTSLPWTTAEINSLQIGIKLRAYWGVGWQSWAACTQVYCTLHHDCSKYQ